MGSLYAAGGGKAEGEGELGLSATWSGAWIGSHRAGLQGSGLSGGMYRIRLTERCSWLQRRGEGGFLDEVGFWYIQVKQFAK